MSLSFDEEKQRIIIIQTKNENKNKTKNSLDWIEHIFIVLIIIRHKFKNLTRPLPEPLYRRYELQKTIILKMSFNLLLYFMILISNAVSKGQNFMKLQICTCSSSVLKRKSRDRGPVTYPNFLRPEKYRSAAKLYDKSI